MVGNEGVQCNDLNLTKIYAKKYFDSGKAVKERSFLDLKLKLD